MHGNWNNGCGYSIYLEVMNSIHYLFFHALINVTRIRRLEKSTRSEALPAGIRILFTEAE